MIEVDQTMDKGWPSGNLLNFGVHLIPGVHGWAGIYHAVDCTLYFLKGVCGPLDRFANKLRRNVSEAVRATHTVTKKEVYMTS